jgi:hypothetical protein
MEPGVLHDVALHAAIEAIVVERHGAGRAMHPGEHPGR